MATPRKKENRGGRRAGAGAKPQTLSGRQIQAMLNKAKKWAKEQGKDIDDILLFLIYNSKTTDRDRLASIKLWKDYTMARISEGGEADRQLGPSIYLPEQKPILAAVTDIKDAKKSATAA